MVPTWCGASQGPHRTGDLSVAAATLGRMTSSPATPGVRDRGPDHHLITHVTLRVALAGVALAILAAVVVDRVQRGCLLTSISAYWWTDARPVLVGGLVAIGVALVAYSGSTWTENLLLDLAGVLAPVVAFAPTVLEPGDAACLGVPFPAPYDASVADVALLVYLGALVVGTGATYLASAAVRRQLGPLTAPQRLARLVGLGAATVLVAGLVGWRLLDPRFAAHVHFPAAATMFVLLTGVVAGRTEPVSRLTARWDLYRDDDADRAGRRSWQRFPYGRCYAVVAVVMVLTLVAVVPVSLLGWWDHAVIAAEVVLLLAFLVFWLLQTVQLRLLAPTGGIEAQGDQGSKR